LRDLQRAVQGKKPRPRNSALPGARITNAAGNIVDENYFTLWRENKEMRFGIGTRPRRFAGLPGVLS
jgi:hypothetical protein